MITTGIDKITCKTLLLSTYKKIKEITKEINTTFKPSNIICIAFSFITLFFYSLLKCIIYIYFIGLPKGNTVFCSLNKCKCYAIAVPVRSIDTRCTCFAFPAKLFCFLKAGELQPVNYPLVYTFHSICKFDRVHVSSIFLSL